MRRTAVLMLIAVVVCLSYLAWTSLRGRRQAGPGGGGAAPAPEAVQPRQDPAPAGRGTGTRRHTPSRMGELGGRPTPWLAPVPVALNRGPEVRDGFRGDVHPLLHGGTRLEVTAVWTPIGKGRDRIDRTVTAEVYSWFTGLKPAQPRRTYTGGDFSAFLPEAVGEVGQVWSLDADRVAEVLKQFHPRPSMRLVAVGRRGGPDGAFAVLRAVSPAYLDIAFRVHAEFYLTPNDPGAAPVAAWYSPAYFSGRMLVNRQAGTVEYFQLGLPADKALNVHLTVDGSALVGFPVQAHDIVRVERMELSGGDSGLAEKVHWEKELAPAEAQRRLAKVFFKFLEIDWVPLDQALARARARGRPIFAIVSWGSFDDQSC